MNGLVDWDLTKRVAAGIAGDAPAAMGDLDLSAIAERAEEAVLDYTGLRPEEPIPAAEWVTRREWTQINIDSMRELIAPVEERLASSLPAAGHGAAKAVAGRVLGAEIGLLLGVTSKRVLGQFEFSMAGIDRPPRLVFVGASIEDAADKIGGGRAEVLEWVALHEGTHAAHFAAAPWLRDHLGGLTGELLANASLQASPRELLDRARRAAGSDPRQALASVRRSDPLTLLAPEASRETIARVQATMASIEGYAEHVMDAAAGDLGDAVERLRAGMERRREARNPMVRLLSWLLGFEMKLRQYREGKRFCDDVVARAGIGALNRAWAGAEYLPDQAELADPQRWVGRTRPLASLAE